MLPTLSLRSGIAQHARAKTIGFIGLGAMGKEMSSHLLNKSFAEHKDATFVVCDADQQAVTRFLTAQTSLHPTRQIVPSMSPGSLARTCGTIVTMLPSSPQVRDVYLGEGGLLSGLEDATPGAETLCIDCTTCDRETGVDVSRILRESSASGGTEMIDAPVSGGVAGAAAGTLTFLVGSDSRAVFEKAEADLLKMGARAIHCGPNGTGLTAKIANNLVLGANMLATAEGMALGIWGGLKPETMAYILNTSTGKSWSSEVNNPVPGALSGTKFSPPAERDYEGGFAARLQAKDLRLALQAAEQVGLPVPMTMLASRIYDNIGERDDFQNKDFSVAFKALIESAQILKEAQEGANEAGQADSAAGSKSGLNLGAGSPKRQYSTMARRQYSTMYRRGYSTHTHAAAASATTPPPPPPSASSASGSQNASGQPSLGPLRTVHPPSHLASYFYPAPLRQHYLTLQSLFMELASVPATVSSEILGRIRYGWWRDAIQACFRKQGSRYKHPIIIDLEKLIWDPEVRARGGVVQEHFEAIVDAWERALAAPASPPTRDALEAQAERLYSRQYYLHLNLLGVSDPTMDEVFSHLGKATGLIESIVSLPSRMGVKLTAAEGDGAGTGGRVAKNRKPPLSETERGLCLPLEYLQAHSVVQEDVLRRGGQADGFKDAVFDTATRANDYLITVRKLLRAGTQSQAVAEPEKGRPPSLSPAQAATLARPAVTAAALIPYTLERLESYDFDPFEPAFRMEAKGHGYRLPWKMWRTNWTGKI